MKYFADKNALFDIIKSVRDDTVDSKEGLKRIFKLLLSIHGRAGVVDGELVYTPDYDAYLNYVDRSASLFTMNGAGGSPMPHSMRMAILEEAQDWEIRVGEQICSQVNEALLPFDKNAKMMLLEQYVNGWSIPQICKNYKIGRRQFYSVVRPLRGSLIQEFRLKSRKQEEFYLKTVKKYIDKSVDGPLKKRCQEKLEINLEIIEWEKSL